ncbi:GGDEF domain-containing protein [Streptomyces sp. RB6PN25]|uniref:GGDEF domain-containing protein n=1 Tax=Streptomyces humicola TaxID=2953240 RepID=A0ABT1Q0Y8_9ACTN|nr:GGDEF domain-containing protein [Streptomyces humicola]MCQ4083544.1 GGDEF domain-containing protein [Streptomyces humicola]
MPSWTDQLRFAFQPVVNVVTGSIVALEVLARPEEGDILGRAQRLPDLDVELAARAVRAAAPQETLLPLHVNLFAATLAGLPEPTALLKAVREAGRRPWEVTVDVGAPFAGLWHDALRAGVRALRDEGYRICVDGVGDGDVPMRLLAELAPDIVKIDASLTRALPDDGARRAMVSGMRRFCEACGGRLAVEGVETERQFAAVRELGVHLAQGNLFAPATRRATADVYRPPVPPAATAAPSTAPAGPSVAQFLRPAALLPLTVSADQVRALLTRTPDASGVVLVDDDGIPVRTIDRDRFLLSLSGRYGHALHADRPALRLGDLPRTIAVGATAWEVLDVVAADSTRRTGDDVVVVDPFGRCVGVVRLADIVRSLAESRVEEAASLNPLTRLPGSDAVNSEVERRIQEGLGFALSWLDVDGFKQVNDGAGFAAGDELIRAVGRQLADAAARLPGIRVGHIGGDDFLVLCDPAEAEQVAAAVLDRPWSAGGRPVTLSLATLVCGSGRVADHHEAAAHLAPLKKEAKAQSGSSWVRGYAGSAGRHVLRGGTGECLSRG